MDAAIRPAFIYDTIAGEVRKIMSLPDLTFVREKGSVIFPGPPGAGKTHLAVSLALKACQAGAVITSSKAFSGWTELLHDPVIVTAFLDRLLHHSVAVNIRGSSCRLRGKVGKEGVKMGQI